MDPPQPHSQLPPPPPGGGGGGGGGGSGNPRKRKSVSFQRGGEDPSIGGQRRRTKRSKRGGRGKKNVPLGEPDYFNLHRQNRKGARRFYQQQGGSDVSVLAAPLSAPRTTPRTVPRAPFNTTSFLIAEHGGSPEEEDHERQQQGAQQQQPYVGNWAAPDDLDEGAALLGVGLDYFGTNEGLVRAAAGRRDSDDDSSSDDASSDGDERGGDAGVGGYELHFAQAGAGDGGGGELGGGGAAAGAEGAGRALPRAVVARLEEQATYIAQLEDENLNLRERVFLLQQECEELRRRGDLAVPHLNS